MLMIVENRNIAMKWEIDQISGPANSSHLLCPATWTITQHLKGNCSSQSAHYCLWHLWHWQGAHLRGWRAGRGGRGSSGCHDSVLLQECVPLCRNLSDGDEYPITLVPPFCWPSEQVCKHGTGGGGGRWGDGVHVRRCPL